MKLQQSILPSEVDSVSKSIQDKVEQLPEHRASGWSSPLGWLPTEEEGSRKKKKRNIGKTTLDVSGLADKGGALPGVPVDDCLPEVEWRCDDSLALTVGGVVDGVAAAVPELPVGTGQDGKVGASAFSKRFK